MTAIIGDNGNLSLVEGVAYFVYLALALGSYFRPTAVKKEMKAVA